MPVTIADLPDEVLSLVFKFLNTNQLKSLLVFPQLRSIVNDHLYDNSKYVIYFDDSKLEDLKSVEEDMKRQSESEMLRSFHQHIEENEGFDEGYASDFEIVMEDDDGYSTPVEESVSETDKDFPGLRISHLSKFDKLVGHVSKFKNFQVNISISHFTEIIDRLEFYKDLILSIFESQAESHDGKFTQKNIKLLIRLNYSLNSFNDVKDCLMNIDKITEYFNRSGENLVQIDLDLNKE
ncbi:uncharacterized protein RJT20DRAFT_57325 [Scheffersomyces xylosifermentans]|uniref:uncharacterized protein n=1 Tax=Scheffersomyces xylosifermentans TaxID=1304137 RepID=UPI00315C83D0